jgi:hypothetical protein
MSGRVKSQPGNKVYPITNGATGCVDVQWGSLQEKIWPSFYVLYLYSLEWRYEYDEFSVSVNQIKTILIY